jgi:hypothetical protein
MDRISENVLVADGKWIAYQRTFWLPMCISRPISIVFSSPYLKVLTSYKSKSQFSRSRTIFSTTIHIQILAERLESMAIRSVRFSLLLLANRDGRDEQCSRERASDERPKIPSCT